MQQIRFNVSKDDAKLILEIVTRAEVVATDLHSAIDRMSLTMDLTATHANGCALKLADLLAANRTDFIHDVFGIMRHINRETGQLGDCFVPRYAA